MITRALLILSALLLLAQSVPAGQWGKIRGTVRSQAGERPLAGADVVLPDTRLGTSSDIDGRFLLLMVPPGIYDLEVRMMGFKTRRYDRLPVQADRTINLEIYLEETTLEAEALVVTAERSDFRRDVTSKESRIDLERLDELPDAGMDAILLTQSGITEDGDGQIHIRGGRSDEVLVLVDGLSLTSPFSGDHVGIVNPDLIQELTVLAGTFSAEYGNVMSGVVNVVTRRPRKPLEVRFRYTSPSLVQSPWREADPFGVGDQHDWDEYTLVDHPAEDYPELLGKMPGETALTLSGRNGRVDWLTGFMNRSLESHLPYGYESELQLTGKLGWQLKPNLRFQSSLQSGHGRYLDYNHSWKYNPSGDNLTLTDSNGLGLTMEYQPSDRFFLTLGYNWQQFSERQLVPGLSISDYRMPVRDDFGFVIDGHQQTWRDALTDHYQIRGQFTGQLDDVHELRAGFQQDDYTLNVQDVEQPAGIALLDSWLTYPSQFGAYVQDKIEMRDLVTVIGLRYDHLDPNIAGWSHPESPFVDTGTDLVVAYDTDLTAPKSNVSPRIGLSFPVTDETFLHLSYGHFVQYPPYVAFYTNRYADLEEQSLPLISNPDIKEQKTVAYELGLLHRFDTGIELSATGWYKDVTNLLSTRLLTTHATRFVVYDNTDYASIRGVDLSGELPWKGGVLRLDYTWMLATGNSSDPRDGYISAYQMEEVPHNEFPLDFDQRHDIVLQLGQHEFGALHPLLQGFHGSLLWHAASGLPYTPYEEGLEIPQNSARMPWRIDLGFQFGKRFRTPAGQLEWFVRGTNLLDRRNVLYVFARTGKPFNSNFSGGVDVSPDSDHNPAHVSVPRQIKTGLIWEF